MRRAERVLEGYALRQVRCPLPCVRQVAAGGEDGRQEPPAGNGRVTMAMNPYMAKTEELLREGKAMLDRRSTVMRAATPAFSAVARRRKLMKLEARFAEVSRRFELLRTAGTDGIADLKVGLEKAFDAFRSEMGWKP